MKVLFIGDVVAPSSLPAVRALVQRVRRDEAPDLVIANGENIHPHNGITEKLYRELLAAGVDVVTLGNHAWDQPQVYHFIDGADRLVRPFNYPPDTPGTGVVIVDAGYRRVAVMAAMGNVDLSTLPSPFGEVERELDALAAEGIRHIILDMHAEATSEKAAFAHFLDGKVSAVLGTHTHVPTADARILPKGTAFQTDVGMTGPYHSVLGMRVENSVLRFVTQRRVRYEQAESNPVWCCATLLTLGDDGRAEEIRPMQYYYDEQGGLQSNAR